MGLAVLAEIVRQVQDRLVEHAALGRQERGQQATHAAAAIEEGWIVSNWTRASAIRTRGGKASSSRKKRSSSERASGTR